MPAAATETRVESVRAFNRFITRRFGILERGFLGTNHSLTEGRVLYELAQRREVETRDLRELLGLDSGYLSRLLARLERKSLVSRERSAADARRLVVRLTPAGQAAFAELDRRSEEQVTEILGELEDSDQRRLVGGMNAVRHVLERRRGGRAVTLRSLQPGDLGWVVHRHGVIYHSELGWDQTMEGFVARIVADFADQPDPRRSNAWIAEVDGRPAGCVFCAPKDSETAQLRLLLVEPHARGLGVGTRLVEECVAFARRAGYREITLWTNDVLTAARSIYEAAGFELTDEEPHHSFGHDLVGQHWRLQL